MLETATVSFDISDHLGNDFDPRRTKVWVTTNVPGNTIVDTEGDQIRLGSGTTTVAADGTGSLSVWVPDESANPASWQTSIHVDYPDRAATSGRTAKSFGPFTIGPNVKVTNKALTSNVATLTTGTAHGLLAGDKVTVLDVAAPFAGTWTVATAPTTTTFTFAVTNANVTSVATTGRLATSLADLVAEMPVQPEYLTTVLETVQEMIDEALGEFEPPATGNGGSLIVSAGGTIDLDNSLPNGTLVGYRFTGTATVEGTVLTSGSYVFERDSTVDSGWSYRTLEPSSELAPYVEPTPEDQEATPQQPTWNDGLYTYTIAGTTGVQYKKSGTNIAAGSYSATSAEAVTITAAPKSGYVFPGGVATSWSHTFPTTTSWVESFNDTLLSPTGAVSSRSGWTFAVAGGSGPDDAAVIDGSGLYVVGFMIATADNPVEALKNFVQCEYDLSAVGTGVDRFYIDVARAAQPHRHILRREDSTTVRLELWYHNALPGGPDIYIPGLPLAGTFRAESDGTYVYAYVNGTKVAEAPHDTALLGGQSPVKSRIVVRGEGNTNTKARAKNVIMGTKA